ncbi:MAG TPA: hypothetical protein VL882_15950 [Vicinamibacterales bacterium]|jgi:hypothetical protein|nr:hypothetical protein [Vicinamibacterales bacterium]
MENIVWLGPTAWALLYCSDYYLTIACAHLYARQDKIKFEGSYELNPMFEAEIDALRRISPRFIAMLIVSTAALFVVGVITVPQTRSVYLFMLGALLMIQLTVHVRHLRNWLLFHHALRPGGMTGHLEYRRDVIFRASAFEILEFGVLYAFIYAFTPAGPFVLGGAFACGVLAISHYRLARARREARAR